MARKHLISLLGAVIALAILAAAAVVVIGRFGKDDGADTALAGALRMAPADTERFSWTDWTGVRREVGLDLNADSPGPAVQDLLDRGFETDLTSSSALGESALVMQERLGFSPATLDWELFSQGPATASLVMRVGPGVDYDVVASSLLGAGYAEPAEVDGNWEADPETDAITSQVTPELNFVSLDRERSLIYASDNTSGINAAVEAGRANESAVLPPEVVAAAGEPVAAALYTGDHVCSALAMANADVTDLETGEALVAAAGDVNPITGFSMGADADGDVRVVMSFETEEQALTNAETRAALATGPAPGQGGDFADRFALKSAAATGMVVTLDLAPVPGAYVLSDLSTGPLLFATC